MDFDHYFPAGFSLETDRVLLRPMEETDYDSFLQLAQSNTLWKYFSKELSNGEQLQAWMQEALSERAARRRVPFTIVKKEGGAICGSTSYGNISFYDKRIEIGWSWLGENFLGSGINHHCKYALLKYAFETLRFERTEIKTDNLNGRARQALRNIGATEEGVLRSHMQMPHGRRRDSVFYSILLGEWNRVKQQFFRDME
ncbi:MAG: GNAT family N-acetyltransferase [Williamsia sp.]|nr:GNAT family N-acetyltransferase [Williamsia sp.]